MENQEFYDALRAMHRKLYTQEVKLFFREVNGLRLKKEFYAYLIEQVKKGVYENLPDDFYNKSSMVLDKDNLKGFNKSSIAQDYMSPLELRINTLALRRAMRFIKTTKTNDPEIIEQLCYNAGMNSALELVKLRPGFAELNFDSTKIQTSSKTLVKKYNKQLKMKAKLPNVFYTTFESNINSVIKYRQKCQEEYDAIIQKLTQQGFNKVQINTIFESLNSAYYDVSHISSTPLEITKFFTVIDENNFKSEDIKMNYEKLAMLHQRIKVAINNNSLKDNPYKLAKAVGVIARDNAIKNHRVLPEMHKSFYFLYAVAEKIRIEKESKTVKDLSKGDSNGK